jgi:uncharacterized protein YkwD
VSRLRKTLGAIAMVAAWMLVTGSPASASSCPNTEVQVTGLSQSAMEGSIACLINEQRAAYGVVPVQPNASLREAALSHSTEMVNQGYFEHTSPAGVTFVDRIEATGYTRGASVWEVGENLVWGTGTLSTPGSLVTSWMNSPPHRENLLRGRFREIGIAAVVGTPRSSSDASGVTVSSEYGYRAFAKAKAKKKRHRRKARKAHRRHLVRAR